MGLEQLSREALEEWRASPALEAVKQAFLAQCRGWEKQCKEAAWQGRPWPEEQRLGLHRATALIEAIFDADVEELQAMMEMEDDER